MSTVCLWSWTIGCPVFNEYVYTVCCREQQSPKSQTGIDKCLDEILKAKNTHIKHFTFNPENSLVKTWTHPLPLKEPAQSLDIPNPLARSSPWPWRARSS